MLKKFMAFAAVLCCACTLFIACQNEPVGPAGEGGDIVGSWYGEVTDNTYALWNYGPVWANTTFNADGTGRTVIYYLYDTLLLGREDDVFTYTTDGGQLTMVQKDNQKTITANYSAKDNKLVMQNDDRDQTFAKTNDDMAKKFDEWNKKENVIPVAPPCKHTVFVYGNAGGAMDHIIEQGFWEAVQPYLEDSTNMRVVCMYKYGLPDSLSRAQYAEPGDIVWFELNSRTDLTKIKESGFQALGYAQEAKELKICNPNTLRFFMEVSSLCCPAEKYTLAIWGHGSGFNPTTDVPGKYDLSHPAPMHMPTGVIPDDWNADEELDMYELSAAIKATGVGKLHSILFHNCLMGNIETLSQISDCADYIGASEHVLCSGGEVLTGYLYGLIEKNNAEEATAVMFDEIASFWTEGYKIYGWNGDFKLMRTDKFEPIMEAAKRLVARVTALYPSQKEAINKATSQAYRVVAKTVRPLEWDSPFYDLADYARLLAKETNDAELNTIAADIDRAFREAIVQYRDVNFSPQHLDHYTLTVCVVSKKYYEKDYKGVISGCICDFDEGYEQCDFHKYTGWGNWLRMNEQSMDMNPRCGGQ